MEIKINNYITMKNKIKIIWIDDIDEREALASTLEEYIDPYYPKVKIKSDFKNTKNRRLTEIINPILLEKPPDLIIIDHFLDKMKDAKMISKGSIVAQIFRDKWPTCPIVGISAASKHKDIDISNQMVYEDLFSSSNISSNFTSIIVIASTFNFLKKNFPRELNDIVKLLKPPQDEFNKIKLITKFEYPDKLNNSDLISRISKWIRFSLFKPGFLYDELWVATLVGLNMDGFIKYKNRFNSALYKGIFSDPINPRWWKSKIKELIFKSFPKSESSISWVVGRNITKNKLFYSKCYSCGKEYPEIVGYTDERKKHKVQLHIRCSIPHPNEERRLYFEETRIMKGGD